MIRIFITPDNPTISFEAPESFVGKQIEIIAFALDEGFEQLSLAEKQMTFTALSIDTLGFKFNRDEANER